MREKEMSNDSGQPALETDPEIMDDLEQPVEWLRCLLGLEPDQTPFPWQIDLLQRFLRGDVVSVLDIPTGLGKTTTMGIWLIARALGAALPRRLVYVVDRRAVVDQATEVAESLRAWVAKEPAVADALSLRDRPLPISTLRGQYVDNREWLEDPSLPAIIVGTIDMVGSRLLFSGYGVSSRMRPYHAGLLAVDTLVVLDEAHLVPAFEDLLRQIEVGGEVFGPADQAASTLLPPFQLLSLSATGRHNGSSSMTITDTDRRHPIALKRLGAKKVLTIIELADAAKAPYADEDVVSRSQRAEDEVGRKGKGQSLASALANQAWELTNQGSDQIRCLVFCDARGDAIAVAKELRDMAKSASVPAPYIELFVGGRRVRERAQAREVLAELGFLAGTPVNLDHSAFLIATSAGEVGVDLDAHHMVSDLVAWERMVQRLGRVNRRGDGEAKVVVVLEPELTPLEGTRKALEKQDIAQVASRQLADLTRQLNTLQTAEKAVAKGQRKSEADKAAAKKRKQDENKLKDKISQCKNRIKAFKDADAKIAARHEIELARHKALRQLLDAVGEGGSLSPESLLQLRHRQDLAEASRDATSAEPIRPELTRALVEAWSMTSLDVHPGRPEIAPWLRGFRPNDPPQTTVIWRRHLPVRQQGPFDAKAAKRFFEAAPPHTSEQLETETHRVLNWLIERAAKVSEVEGEDSVLTARQVVAVALTSRGEVKGCRTLDQLVAAKARPRTKESKEAKKAREQSLKQLEQLLAGSTLVLDARLGGLADGLLDANDNRTAEAADDISTPWLNRPDAAGVPVTGFRVRLLPASEEDDASEPWRAPPGNGWVRRHLFVTEEVEGEPSAALVVDGWVGDAASEDERAQANRAQLLDEHLSWAEECARFIARRLELSKDYEHLLALAARLHDEGKRASQWQRAFKAPVDGRHYAKTNGPIDFDILGGYRHELGSLPYAEKHPQLLNLDADDRDLVLHLIAAHHGYARPVIGTSGCDEPPSIIDARAHEVALRFARLSQRWGPWGLAWWEALLRAADQIASRRNQKMGASATVPGG
jgi:CRISPR-associated endonuclease/helicase Cas3